MSRLTCSKLSRTSTGSPSLLQSATDTLNRQLKSGVSDEDLASLVIALRQGGRLCRVGEDVATGDPQVICSPGFRRADHHAPGTSFKTERMQPCEIRCCRRQELPEVLRLKSFDFQTFFREHPGWNNYNQRLEVAVGDQTCALTAVAQKRGFTAFTCPTVPNRATRLKINHHVTRSAREHLVIYVDRPGGQQVWHWVRQEAGKPLASRDHRFHVSQSGDPLIQRLNQIALSLDEEERITVVDVAGRARAAFDVDRVTMGNGAVPPWELPREKLQLRLLAGG